MIGNLGLKQRHKGQHGALISLWTLMQAKKE
jgi:hypothetical protein